VKFSPDSCFLLPLGAKHFPQHPLLLQPQSTLFPPYDRGSTTQQKQGEIIFLCRIWTPDGTTNNFALRCSSHCPNSSVLTSSNQLNLDLFYSNKFEFCHIFKEFISYLYGIIFTLYTPTHSFLCINFYTKLLILPTTNTVKKYK